MTAKPVIRRAQAEREVQAAAAYFAEVGGPDLATAWIDCVNQAMDQLAFAPLSGSPLWGERLHLAGLRTWTIKRFRYLVFYRDQPDHVDVWRVLHSSRDIPAWLTDPDAGDDAAN